MRAAAAQCHDVVAAEDRARLVAGDQQGDPLGRPEPSVTSVGASVFRIDLDNVVFRITEEQCAVAPVRQVGWCSYDRDTFRNQLGMTGVDCGRRHTEGELNRGRAWCRRAIVPC